MLDLNLTAALTACLEADYKHMEHLPEFIANHLFLFALLVSVLILLFWNLFGTALSGVILVNPREVIRMMNHDGAVMVDIRNAGDFSNGHILGASNIPADRIGEQQSEMTKYKGQTLIICSNTENESVRAGRILKMQGFEKIFSIKGGLQAWRSVNLPLARDTNSKNNPDKEGKTDD